MNNVIAESFRILTWWVCWCYYSSWSGHQFTDHYCFCYLFFTCNKQANMYIYIDKSQSLTMLKIYNCPCCPMCTRASNTINQSILARSVHVHTQPPLFIVCIFSHCMCKMNCGHFFFNWPIQHGDGDRYTNTSIGGDENFIWLTKTKRCLIWARNQSYGTVKERRTINIGQSAYWLASIAR